MGQNTTIIVVTFLAMGVPFVCGYLIGHTLGSVHELRRFRREMAVRELRRFRPEMEDNHP